MPKRRLVVRRYRAKLTDEQLALLDRDVNAAKNILAWGLDPSNHAKHITLGIDPTLLVVKV